ncbi:cytochrome P450 [Gloeopeniophorella convolvens]|nr:cytochrome P450 [Gloeopeniophorella convolvens]
MSSEQASDVLVWRAVLGTLACIFFVSRSIKFRNALKMLEGIPGPWVPFCPMLPPGAAIRTYWWNPGVSFVWDWRLSFYKKWGSEIVSIFPFLHGPPIVYTNSLDIARQFVGVGYQSTWGKPHWATRVLDAWGANLVTTNGEDWRRHRRIVGPAFNNSTYSLVWSETLRVYRDMVSTEGWTGKASVSLQPVQAYTIRLALFVISACGFGVSSQWDCASTNEDGTMSMHEAMRIWVDSVFIRVIAPSWVYKLPFKKLRQIPVSIKVLQDYLTNMIAERRADLSADDVAQSKEKKDVFSLLIRANEEDGKLNLSDSELVGNVFAMLFAGHETTAFTLAAAVGLLALHPKVQEEAYQQIAEVVGHDRDPTFEDFPYLDKIASAFYETLRLYPAGHFVVRESSEDTFLNVSNGNGQAGTRQVPIPKGITVVVDMAGVHYNPRYFPEPYKYDPTRWRGASAEVEDVTAFSIGPRTCIGRKFAAVEAVCFLTLLIRDWTLEPIMNPGESGEQWRERVMQADAKMTLCVQPIPVRLRKRVGML